MTHRSIYHMSSLDKDGGWTIVGAKDRIRLGTSSEAVRAGSSLPRKMNRNSSKLQRKQEEARGLRLDDSNNSDPAREDLFVQRITGKLLPALVASHFFENLAEQIDTDTFESIIVLGIGRLSSEASVLQLTLCIALKDLMVSRCPDAICVISDPVLEPSDERVIRRLGLATDSVNTKGKIHCSKKTLLFMPHCPYGLYSNVLWSNWGRQLRDIAILGNSFESYRLRRIDNSDDSSDCVRLLAPITRERSVWSAVIERHAWPRVLEHANMAFADLSLMDFPTEGLLSGERELLSDLLSKRPSEESIDLATQNDGEIF